jgi:hypothetical protein
MQIILIITVYSYTPVNAHFPDEKNDCSVVHTLISYFSSITMFTDFSYNED